MSHVYGCIFIYIHVFIESGVDVGVGVGPIKIILFFRFHLYAVVLL